MTDKKADVLREASVFANIWKNNTRNLSPINSWYYFFKNKMIPFISGNMWGVNLKISWRVHE